MFIQSSLQALVDFFLLFLLLEPTLLKLSTRVAKGSLPFYDINWLINTNFYSNIIANFQEFISDILSPAIDPSIQYYIFSMITSYIATTMANVPIKHLKNILTLRKTIEKSLFFTKSAFFNIFSNINASSTVFSSPNLLSMTPKRENRANLGYFYLYLDKVHGKGKIVFINKNFYHINIVMFV